MNWLDNITPDYDVVIEVFHKSSFIILNFSRSVDSTIHNDLLALSSKPGFTVSLSINSITYRIEYPKTYKSSTIYDALVKLLKAHNLTINTINY